MALGKENSILHLRDIPGGNKTPLTEKKKIFRRRKDDPKLGLVPKDETGQDSGGKKEELLLTNAEKELLRINQELEAKRIERERLLAKLSEQEELEAKLDKKFESIDRESRGLKIKEREVEMQKSDEKKKEQKKAESFALQNRFRAYKKATDEQAGQLTSLNSKRTILERTLAKQVEVPKVQKLSEPVEEVRFNLGELPAEVIEIPTQETTLGDSRIQTEIDLGGLTPDEKRTKIEEMRSKALAALAALKDEDDFMDDAAVTKINEKYDKLKRSVKDA